MEVVTSSAAGADLGLVADVGGTNVRFALSSICESESGALRLPRHYRTKDFSGITEAADAYLREVGLAERPRFAAFALAGVVRGEEISITNCPWRLSLGATRAALGVEELFALNDFAAVGWALPLLQPEDQLSIGGHWDHATPAEGSFALLGPGTGLGVSAVRLSTAEIAVTPSEGGHASFAPVSDEEVDVLRCLKQRFGRVSYERLLSGQGLCNIYYALCSLEGGEKCEINPEELTRRARSGEDPLCVRAVDMFCDVLGSFAGDAALMLGAWDGVYLAGNLVSTLREPILRGGFRRRFEEKGRLSDTLMRIPTIGILHPHVGLLGAAVALRRLLARAS